MMAAPTAVGSVGLPDLPDLGIGEALLPPPHVVQLGDRSIPLIFTCGCRAAHVSTGAVHMQRHCPTHRPVPTPCAEHQWMTTHEGRAHTIMRCRRCPAEQFIEHGD